MAHIPPTVADSELTSELQNCGLTRINQGKVRDTFALPDPTKLLIVTTDRISIFDFVLNARVAGKGVVLNWLTVFWLTKVLKDFPNHLVAYGEDIGKYLPQSLPAYSALPARAIVVDKQQMVQLEAIVRGYLTGSGWKDYQATGKVCGIQLPPDLHDGSKLPEPIFTPSTKAIEGHDLNITLQEAAELIGPRRFNQVKDLSLAIYKRGAEYALKHGVIIADTKFEFGGKLADEVLTPDSSRFWDIDEYHAAATKRQSPTGYDKQPMRDAGKTALLPDGDMIDVSKLDPKKSEHRDLVNQWIVPEQALKDCAARYSAIYERLTKETIKAVSK